MSTASPINKISATIGVLLLLTLSTGVWIIRYRPQWLEPAAVEAGDDEDVDPQKLEIPVHVGRITKATLHRYVDAYGSVDAAPSRPGQMAGTSNVAAPVAGIVAQVLCEAGQQVKKNTPLIQLDDRIARATEDQAVAALAETNASLAQLKATPRPEQLEIAQLAVEKARGAVEFSQKGFTRQQGLARSLSTPEKNVEQAAMELAAAQNDLAVSEKQLALLKVSPSPEELAAQAAKVAQAEAALSAARTQRELLTISAPIDGTIVAVTPNPGEFVDTAKILVDLIALDRLVVNVSVPAEEANSLTVGMPVQIIPDSANHASLTVVQTASSDPQGKIFFVGSEVDRKTNTIPVGVDIAPALGAKPGQSYRVRVIAEEHKDCLAAPKESVVADENGDNFVATVEGDQATHKTIHVGLREGDLVEVMGDGLKEGDLLVTSGAYGLAKLQVAKVKVLE